MRNKEFLPKKKTLKNKKILVTAGPCREVIDPVRYISNRSSGKMGYALAEAAFEAGAEVTLVSGPTNLNINGNIKLIHVESTAEMHLAVQKYFKKTDYLIMAAAPADFSVKEPAPQKIKKRKETLTLELSPTVDILNSLKKFKKAYQKVIGFALETENGVTNAKAKLKSKGMDLIILNNTGAITPFDSDDNMVTIINKNGQEESLPSMNKKLLAQKLIDRIASLR